MERVRLRSVADFDAMPEDEWVEVVGGMSFRWAHEIRLEGRRLVVALPAKVRKQLRPAKGEILAARITNRALIVEKRAAPKRKGASRSEKSVQ